MNKNRSSSPIINFLPELGREFSTQFMLLHSVLHQGQGVKPLVALCKERLGKQSYCVTTYRRYWVWEFPTYRVLVNNEAGLSFELILHESGKIIGKPKECWFEFIDHICSPEEAKRVKKGLALV